MKICTHQFDEFFYVQLILNFPFFVTAAAAAAQTNNSAQAAQAAQAAGNGYPNAANQPPPFVLQPHEQQAQFMAALALAGQPIPGEC